MTAVRELVTVLRYELDNSGLMKQGRDEKGRFTALRKDAKEAEKSVRGTETALGRLGNAIKGAILGFGLLGAMRVADEWAGVEGRVGLVTDGIDEQKEALDGLYTAAQRSRQSYAGLASVFQGIARNKTELGLTTEQALALSETVGTAMTIGGGSASSQQAALMQLSQALGTGTLRGEELNSIMEQAPRLAQAIAKAFDVPVGKLKELGEKGKLSSKILAEGLLKQSVTLREEFERMPMTFAGAWVTLSNAMGRQIDKLNRNTGAARAFYRVTSLIVDNLDTIIKYLLWIGSAAILTKLAYASRALAASGGLLNRALAKFGGARAFGLLIGTFARMLAVATAVYYVFDDIGVWFRGGDSLIGDVLGPMTDWKWLVDAVKNGLTFVKDALGGSAQTLAEFVSKWGIVAVIIGGIVAAIGTIPALVLTIIVAWASVFNYVKKNWDSLIADTIYNIERLGNALKNLVPAGLRSFFTKGDSIVKTPYELGSASFGVTPTALPTRTGLGSGTTMITQAPAVTVYATTPQPAAVAEAARRGTERGMSSAMVPNVEASR